MSARRLSGTGPSADSEWSLLHDGACGFRGRGHQGRAPRLSDDTRAWGPPFVGGQSAYYLSINRSKRSITVDLGQEQGREIIYALARVCDVAIENFRPGTADRIGVGYERLRQGNPCSSSTVPSPGLARMARIAIVRDTTRLRKP